MGIVFSDCNSFREQSFCRNVTCPFFLTHNVQYSLPVKNTKENDETIAQSYRPNNINSNLVQHSSNKENCVLFHQLYVFWWRLYTPSPLGSFLSSCYIFYWLHAVCMYLFSNVHELISAKAYIQEPFKPTGWDHNFFTVKVLLPKSLFTSLVLYHYMSSTLNA
jgi:hypothetical protein